MMILHNDPYDPYDPYDHKDPYDKSDPDGHNDPDDNKDDNHDDMPKVGTRMYADFASEEKRRSQALKSQVMYLDMSV